MSNMDIPNGDLAPGDFFWITEWVGHLAEERPDVVVMGFPPQAPVESGECQPPQNPNRELTMDLIEVLEIDYPIALVCVHGWRHGQYLQGRATLNLREFECRKTKPRDAAKILRRGRAELIARGLGVFQGGGRGT